MGEIRNARMITSENASTLSIVQSFLPSRHVGNRGVPFT